MSIVLFLNKKLFYKYPEMDDPAAIPNIKNSGIAEILVNYLSLTKPGMLFLHLVWLTIVCIILSFTYVLAFHFTSLVTVYQEAHNIQQFNTNLLFSARQDAEINNILNDLMSNSKANRAYVFRYHNGLAAISGVPFFFQSNTHEVISPGTPRVVQFEQRIPASINLAISNQFMQNRCAIVSKADEDKDSQNYWFYQNRGAKSLIRCPIFMNNGDLFGFVGVDYLERYDAHELETIASRVKSSAGTLSSLFASKP